MLDKTEKTEKTETAKPSNKYDTAKGVIRYIKNKNKLELSWWPITCLIGNLVEVFGSGLCLTSYEISSTQEILIGMGCMICYCGIGRYIEYNSEYSAIYSTLKSSLPNVMRYLFGVMPIFFGFTFLGVCLFWRSDRFSDTSSTMNALFALMHGDSIFDILKDLSSFSFLLGQIYIYIFCTLFIVIVLNVFISIIEEAYIVKKLQNKNHWVNDYLKLDREHAIFKDQKDPNDLDVGYGGFGIERSKSRKFTAPVKKFESTQNLLPKSMFLPGQVHGLHGSHQADRGIMGSLSKRKSFGRKDDMPIVHGLGGSNAGSIKSFEKKKLTFASPQKETVVHQPQYHPSMFKEKKVLDNLTKLEIDKVVENHFGSVNIIILI